MSRSRPVLERGQWAEPGITLTRRIEEIKAEARAGNRLAPPADPKLFRGIINATPVAVVLWIAIAAAFWGAWVGSPS